MARFAKGLSFHVFYDWVYDEGLSTSKQNFMETIIQKETINW